MSKTARKIICEMGPATVFINDFLNNKLKNIYRINLRQLYTSRRFILSSLEHHLL